LNASETYFEIIFFSDAFVEPNTFLAITATSQTKGRGTNKRKWIGRKGNTFLTIAVPSNELKIPLTLLPLQIGNILAKQVKLMLKKTNAVVTLKWPNDVLVDQKKIAGVLIESDKDHAGNYYFLIGIGVNYRFAPLVETSGNERGRITTCIYDYVNGDDDDDNDKCGVESAKALGKRIAGDVRDWVKMQKNWDGAADSVVAMWDTWAEYGNKLILRDEPGNQSVTPLGLERDGRLRVKGQDGKERLLSSDYLL
jgi:BirA family biotin operon repressor/biotin-[acetyl-CoA-carboxylase] ligase